MVHTCICHIYVYVRLYVTCILYLLYSILVADVHLERGTLDSVPTGDLGVGGEEAACSV